MTVVLAYASFVLIAALCFVRLPLRVALLLVVIGGWWALPVGHYAAVPPGTKLPWWITGIALPSDMLMTKAWLPPAVAFVGAAIKNNAALRAWRPAIIDLPMVAWCVWPLADSIGVRSDPPGVIGTSYLLGTWGLPWLIGRVWLVGPEGTLALIRGLALSGLVNAPVALIEGGRPAMLYGALYGSPHPYRYDGVVRYVGYRPIGFLEHGNLYGLWAAIAAFAAIWLVRTCPKTGARPWLVIAAVNVAIALASQSVGALLLLIGGLVLLWFWRSAIFVPAMTAAAAISLFAAAVHLSGIVPVQALAHTPTGERVIGQMRSLGRGSLLWRVSQDSRTLEGAMAHPVGGTVHWDWWRPYGRRPWGQPLLVIGQYGLVGLLLAWGALLGASIAGLARLRKWGDRIGGDALLPLALIVLFALADATLNAFFYSPAILAAGAIAVWPRRSARRRVEARSPATAPQSH